LQLVLKTAGKEPVIMEQPVYVTVEEPKETLQATATPQANTAPANGTK
jgi:hypothetical protein